MVAFKPQISPVVVNNHISVEAAAMYSGYSLQYLRQLLRNGKLITRISSLFCQSVF